MLPTLEFSTEPSVEFSVEPSLAISQDPTAAPIVETLEPTLSAAPSISFQPTLEQIYRYDQGACPFEGETGLGCADPSIRNICDRYDEERGSFTECWNLCRPSFCCIHDAPAFSNFEAPSCSRDENCAQYAYCYIVWFKFHDTLGPATRLNVEQNGRFFDLANSEVRGNRFGDFFFDQLFFHHFDDSSAIIELGENENGEFDPALVFDVQTNWERGLPDNNDPANNGSLSEVRSLAQEQEEQKRKNE